MSGRVMKTVAAAALAMGLGISLAHASADEAIQGRQGCMKAHGKMMGVLVPMFKGEKPFEAAAMTEAMTANDAACADWSKWWGADAQTSETNLKTRAKPEIWTDAAGFEAAGGTFYNAYVALQAAKDEASFKAAFPAVGKACHGCHEKYRVPEE